MESPAEFSNAEEQCDDSPDVNGDPQTAPALRGKLQGPVYLPMPREQASMAVILFLCAIGMAFYFWHRGIVENGLIDIDRAEHVEIEYLVDINHAPWPALANLPGIGPKLAEEIVRFRERSGPIKQIEDIKEIRGIGDSKLDAIRDFIAPISPTVVAEAETTDVK